MAPDHVFVDLTVKVIPHDGNNPPGKLANAELHSTSVPIRDLDIIENALRQLHEASGKLRDDRIEAARAAVRRARQQAASVEGVGR